MAINPSYIGRTYPPSEPYEVGREKIREFADAIGDPNPIYRDPAAARAVGHPDVIAPPTFAAVLTMRLAAQAVFDPALGVDYSRVVHGEQRFTYSQPIRAGDKLVGVLCIVDLRKSGRNEVMITQVDVSTAAGEPVCSVYSSLIVRGGAA